MSEFVPDDLRATLQDILSQLENLAERVTGVEKLVSAARHDPVRAAVAVHGPSRVSEAPPETSSVAAAAGISEEELLAISAALAAWLGVHAHIRQIRLIRSGTWAQQGRVTIQASHWLRD